MASVLPTGTNSGGLFGGVDAVDGDEPVVTVRAVPLLFDTEVKPGARSLVELGLPAFRTVVFEREAHEVVYSRPTIVVYWFVAVWVGSKVALRFPLNHPGVRGVSVDDSKRADATVRAVTVGQFASSWRFCPRQPTVIFTMCPNRAAD